MNASMLLLLQHGDSFFPSGSVAFSYGMESLVEDAKLAGENDVAGFLNQHLSSRWACFERSVLREAWFAQGNLDVVQAADAIGERMSLPYESRSGSSRAGRALLSVHTALGTPGAVEYAGRIAAGEAWGHLCVVQGLVWWGVGLTVRQAETLSVHTLCVGVAGAAIRLGVIGHTAAQRVLTQAHACAEQALQKPPLGLNAISAFTPAADIAMMRHERQASRMFSN